MSKHKNKSVIIEDKVYTLVAKIGDGGNGEVWSAKTLNDPTEYAIKIINVKTDEYQAGSIKGIRLKKEIEFCETSEHPNILKVLGHGEFDGKPCYVMPRYPCTLRNVIETEINYEQLIDYIIQLCEGLLYIHSQGIVHRDIKPENILIGIDHSLVLADFGIAHFIDINLTRPNDWLGNKAYAAPEQIARGFAKDTTSACDIYALGAITNELFTKHRPMGADFISIADKIPYLWQLDNLVSRCMAQDPSTRPRIDDVLIEIRFLKSQLNDELDEIENLLAVAENTNWPETTVNSILRTASEDLLCAKYLFGTKSSQELQVYNAEYHGAIRYTISDTLKNMCFQKLLFKRCQEQFYYESNIYASGQNYNLLDLDNPLEYELYDKFRAIIVSRRYGSNDLAGRILKLFHSCCDYHCQEIFNYIKHIERIIEDLTDAPIMYLLVVLRSISSANEAQNSELIDHIDINWESTTWEDLDDRLYTQECPKEQRVLSQFQKDWDIIYYYASGRKYNIKFKSMKEFERFSLYARTLSEHYFIFQGDVEKILKNPQEHGGIVALAFLDSFDISSTLAKILGLRTDYR